MMSPGDATAVFTTPGEAPRTLQKEWGDSLELDLNGDMIRVILVIRGYAQSRPESVTARSPPLGPKTSLGGSNGSWDVST